MNLKAQALLNAANYIEAEYGRDVLGRIVRDCSPAVRDRYTSAIAINWHPLEEFVEFLQVAERVTGDPLVGDKVGAAGARANTRGVLLRTALLLARPEQVLRRASTLWRQFNDAGELALVRFAPGSADIEIKGIPLESRLFCATITGWAREIVTSAGGKGTFSRHEECRAAGGARCVWMTKWSADGGA